MLLGRLALFESNGSSFDMKNSTVRYFHKLGASQQTVTVNSDGKKIENYMQFDKLEEIFF